ncbi:MAG: methionyl-tRNA formyltransferase [Chloroflexi bacterium]|nr:methionyl-tRNA formyltransferase [Chloroflexota bacterium]
MRVVFLGSPEFALPSLRRIIESDHDIAGVFTQPDRPVGRGRRLAPPPVKTLAIEHGLPVFQPLSISKPEAVEQMRALAPDVAIIAAYGQILRQRVLDVPRLGVLNVHASLLPRWRGAAPVPAAILAGDERTGATIMRVVLALDAGPMLDRIELPILPEDTAGTVLERIAEAGAELLMRVLPAWEGGAITPQEQDEALATYAPQIKKSDALIDWQRESAADICRKVRAYNPWPIAYSYLDGQPLRVYEAAMSAERTAAPPGTLVEHGDGIACAAADAAVVLLRVQGPGGKALSGAEYRRGHPDIIGKRLSAKPG